MVGMYVYVTRKEMEVLIRAIESRISELESLNFTLGNMYDDELRRLDDLKKVLERHL